jgi:hypothetical protein
VPASITWNLLPCLTTYYSTREHFRIADSELDWQPVCCESACIPFSRSRIEKSFVLHGRRETKDPSTPRPNSFLLIECNVGYAAWLLRPQALGTSVGMTSLNYFTGGTPIRELV